MKLASLVLLALLAPVGASLALPVAMEPHPEDIVALEAPRAPSCGVSPVHLVVVAPPSLHVLVSSLLWSAGLPPGSTVRLVSGIEAPGAIVAPQSPDLAWARGFICP